MRQPDRRVQRRTGVKRGVIALGLVLGLLAWAPPAGANGEPARDQIADAYARVLDRNLAMSERLAALEDGEALRETLRELDALDEIMGMEIRDLDLHVRSIRAFAGDAEVELSVLVNLYQVTGWTGVARKIDGEWVVARSTVCTLLMEWTPVRCPGGPTRPQHHQRKVEVVERGGEAVIPLTFVDGGRAELVVPEELSGAWQAQPHAELILENGSWVSVWFTPGRVEPTQLVRTYDAGPGRPRVALDAMSGLVFHFDEWTATAHVLEESEETRAQVARHLDGYTTRTGWPVLIPSAPIHFLEPSAPAGVRLVKSALNLDYSRNPIELWYVDDRNELSALVAVTPGPCPDALQPVQASAGYHAEERCMPSDVGRIAVEGGDPELVLELLDTIQLRNYRARATTIST
jgi:hypothetical protein